MGLFGTIANIQSYIHVKNNVMFRERWIVSNV